VPSTLSKDASILIVAPNASTLFGGEAILPVHYFRVLRGRGYRVTMIAHARNRDDLAKVFGRDCEGIEFVEDTIWHRAIWQAGKTFPAKIRGVCVRHSSQFRQ
jgi:hypothetical protein